MKPIYDKAITLKAQEKTEVFLPQLVSQHNTVYIIEVAPIYVNQTLNVLVGNANGKSISKSVKLAGIDTQFEFTSTDPEFDIEFSFLVVTSNVDMSIRLKVMQQDEATFL
jgi:hypothetical protein